MDASYDWLDDESMSAMVDEVENSLQEVGTKVEVSQQPTIALTPEQQLVLDLVRSGKVHPRGYFGFSCSVVS